MRMYSLLEGKEINYSMKKMIEYEGEEVVVTMYWNIEEFLSPGTYRVDIFSDGNFDRTEEIYLG